MDASLHGGPRPTDKRRRPPPGRVRPVDLTLAVSASLPSFPGSPPPHFIRWERMDDAGYDLELLLMSSHTGTHVDAPSHFVRGGATVDRIPVSRLVSDALLVDAPGRSARRPITARDVDRFESGPGGAGRIPRGSAVVFRTGWSDDTGRASYFGECPGLTAGAARRLASRGAGLVGIDSPSVDPGNSRRFAAHRALLGAGIPAVENLAGLSRIGGRRFRLAVMPLKLKGATGSPARAVAL